MWNFTLFLPTALLLGLLGVLLTRAQVKWSLGRSSAVAVGLWLSSWLAVVAALYAQSVGSLASSFVPQRDLGYWAGSALLMGAPFIAVFAGGRFLADSQWSQRAKRFTVLAIASGAWVLTPWLFFAGWVMGCVALRYGSCM